MAKPLSPVIQNILSRRNQKVPINDGKKISLVVFGGTMTGVRAGAALVALEQMGLTNVFDNIYTVSIGFLNACYFLSGQIGSSLPMYYQDLNGGKFINFARFWNIMDIDYVINITKKSRRLDVKKILDSKTKLFVNLYKVKGKQSKTFEVHEFTEDEYFKLMRAAISVQYFNPGSIEVKNELYMDHPLTYHHHYQLIEHAISGNSTDILVIYCYNQQKSFVGAGNKLPDYCFEILPPKEWQLPRYSINSKKIYDGCLQMGEFVKNIFGEKGTIQIKPPKNGFKAKNLL